MVMRKKPVVRVVERSPWVEAGTKVGEANLPAPAWPRWRMALPAAVAGTAWMAEAAAAELGVRLAFRPEEREKSLELAAQALVEPLPAFPGIQARAVGRAA